MSEKSKTVHVVELRGQTENLQKALADLRKNFAGMKIPPELDKIFNKLGSSIDSILRKTEKGIVPREDFADTEKEVTKIKTAFEGLADALKALNNADDKKLASMIPKDTVDKLTAVNDAYKKYADTMLKVVEAEQKLAEAEQKKQDAKTKAESSESVREASEKTKANAEAELDKYRDITEALKEQEEAEKALAKAQKELDRAKAEKGGKAIANRQAIYDAAEQRKTKADDKAVGLDATRVAAQKQAIAEVEKATRAYSAAKKQAEEDAKALTDAETKEATAKAALTAVQNKNAQDQAAEAAALKALQDALTAIDPKYKNMAISGQTAGEKLESLRKEVEGLSAQELIKLKKSLKDAGVNFDGFQQELEETKQVLKDTKDVTAATDEALSQKAAFENKIKQFLGLQGAAQLMRAALRDAMATIKELDATMTEMAVVTDLTVGDYWDQLPEYSKRASDLGVSINSAYKAATLYYQQGLKTNEVVALSNETLKMAKISGIDAAEATDKMTAALRGFNMELNEASAQKIADVYSELAAITAADVDEISTAMTKTASIASSAGMEFETTAAFLSQIIETTRESAETAGTAMKTVIARFQELKKSPNEIGEIDGEIVDANAIETALRSVGVSLRDTSGQFRELDDVFLELSSKWSSLDKNTQRYIATIAAGSRQQSRFIAMMQDYSRTQELVTAANNSAGASQKQFEKTMESLEAKVEKLKNAWHEFTMGIANSDLVKFGVDALTKLLEVVNKATSAFGGFAGSLTKIGTVLTVFKVGKSLFQKIPENFKDAMVDVVRQAIEGGEKAAEGAAEGARRKQQELAKQSGTRQEARKEDVSYGLESKYGGFVGKVSNLGMKLSGADHFAEFSVLGKERKELKQISKLTSDEKDDRLKDKRDALQKSKSKKQSLKVGVDDKEIKKVDEEITNLEKDIDNLENTNENLAKNSKKQWSAISNGISSASRTLMGVGVGLSAVGSALEAAGLEDAAEAFNTMSQYATTAGAILGIFPPLLSLIQALFPGVGAASAAAGATATASGLTASAAWGVVGVIVMIVIAAIVVAMAAILLIMAAIKNASPEAKLKKTEEAANGAAEAADRAAESYDNLKNSLDDLDAGYEALENMRRGTDEWNEAVQKLNNSVLDLINQYPELAGLVENKGGVLTLDIDSQEVQAVLQSYENKVATTKGAELGMKARVVEAQQQVDFASLEAVQKVGKQRGWQAFGASVGIGTAIGAKTSPAPGTIGGSILSGLADPKSIATISGAITGATVGAIVGPIKAAGAKTDEELQNAVEGLAKSVQEGATGTDYDSIYSYLIGEGVAADEAKVLAETFAADTKALLEYGATLNATEAAQKAYYQAMATNAQSMIELGKYTEEALDQMSSVVDADRIKAYEDKLKEKYADDDSEVTEAALKKYMEGLEGVEEVKKIKNGKVVYIDEDGKKQKVDKEIYIQQMIAAQATEEAAKAMESVPEALSEAVKAFGDNLSDHEIFKKVFSADEGMALNASELVALDYKELESIYAEMGDAGKEVWATQIEFITDYQERVKKANEAFKDAVKNMQRLGFESDKASELFGKMSAESSKAWTKTLQIINMGGGDVQVFHDELTTLLSGLTEEQINAVMGQINAIDTSDIDAWENLKYVFDDLNIPIATNALQEFIDKGIEVSNAIEKIDFDGLNESLNNTYELIKKIKEEGSRSFGEEEYKKFIASNKELEKQFMQIGDEFVYMGGSIQDLIAALEENTIANIEEANRQLDSKIAFSSIAAGIEKKNVDDMDEAQLREYLNEAISKSSKEGLNVADLGVAGFSNASDLYAEGVDKDTLLKWAQAFAATGGQTEAYEEQKREGIHQANVLEYAYRNTATENAAGHGSAYAEALQYQAIQSGGVSDAQLAALDKAIEELKAAEEDGDAGAIEKAQDNVNSISGDIANATEKIVESNEGRDAMQDLVDRVTEALYDQTQKEIDKLQEIKDATDDANAALISKLQEQIDTSRRQREQERERQNIADMQSQMAYLGMDASGANSLEMVGLEQQIADAEQAYQDSLIDQAIQQLQDANEKAAEQRDRQIALAQEQLDYQKSSGQLAEQAQQIVEDSLDQINNGIAADGTPMGELLAEAETEGMDALATQTWVSDLQGTAIQAASWFSQQGVGSYEEIQESTRSTLISDAEKEIRKNWDSYSGGVDSYLASDTGKAALEDYKKAGGTEEDFRAKISGIHSKIANEKTIQGNNLSGGGQSGSTDEPQEEKDYEKIVKKNGGSAPVPVVQKYFRGKVGEKFDLSVNGTKAEKVRAGAKVSDSVAEELTRIVTETNDQGNKHTVYANIDGSYKLYTRKSPSSTEWFSVEPQNSNNARHVAQVETIENAAKSWIAKNYKYKYETGGLADFTGPAWLDGTPSKPEYVLNAVQTERFFSLIDVLEGYDTKEKSSKSAGDNYFDIDINVEKIEDDYDVEQIANKIRRMIYDDATYRNVNAINHIR